MLIEHMGVHCLFT